MLITSFDAIPKGNVLIYYGGSFNPPHISHILFIVMLRCLLPQARILVAPTWQHAFDKALLPYDLRLEMLHAVLDEVSRIEISTIERDLHQPKSYTFNVVQALHAQEPDTRILVAVGADIPPMLPQWYKYDELMSIADFLVFPRLGYDAPALPIPPLPQISSTDIRQALERRTPEDLMLLRSYVPAKILDLHRNAMGGVAGDGPR